MSVPQELGSAYIEVTTRGIEKAKKEMASVKTNLDSVTKGQDTFNSRLADSTKIADTAEHHFRGLLDSIHRLAGMKVPDKTVKVQADGLDEIESGLAKVQKAANVKAETTTGKEAGGQPVHVSVVADKVHIEQPPAVKVPVEVEKPKPIQVPVEAVHVPVDPVKPVKVPVEAPAPVAVHVDPVKPVHVPVDPVKPVKVPVEAPAPVAVHVDPVKPVHVPVDPVKPVKVPVEAPAPVAVHVDPVKPVHVPVDPVKPVKVPVEAPAPVAVHVDPVKPVHVPVDPVKPVKVPVEAPAPVAVHVDPPRPVPVSIVETGIKEIQAALAAIKAPGVTVAAKAEGIAKIQASIDALKPHSVSVPLLAEGLDEIQQGIKRLSAPVVLPVKVDDKDAKIPKVQGTPVEVPVKADTKPAQSSIFGIKVPSLNIPVAVDSIKAAAAQVGVLKDKVASAATFAVNDVPVLRIMAKDTKAAIEGFGKLKAGIVGALDKVTDVPVLRQLKSGISFVNTKFDEFLTKRYGALAKPIKYSGMAVDMAMMGMGHPIPGGAILGTIPGIAAAEAHKQTTGFLGRRRERRETNEGADQLQGTLETIKSGKTVDINVVAVGIEQVQAQIDKLKSVKYLAGVEVYLANLEAVKARLENIKANPVNVQVDTSAAMAEVAKLKASLNAPNALQRVGGAIAGGIGVAASAASSLASKIKSAIPAPVVAGFAKLGSVAKGAFVSAASGVASFVGGLAKASISTEGLSAFGERAKQTFSALNSTVSQVGGIAARGFAVATGGIGAMVRLADPLGFLNFTTAIQAVSIQIGRIFVPLLHQVTGYIAQLDRFLRSLTDAQREQILSWAKISLVVLGSVMAFSQLFGVISTGFTVLSGFVAVLGAIGIATPVGWIIALTAALVGLAAVVGASSGGFSGIFASLRPALAGLVAAFQTAFAALAGPIQVVLGFISGLIRTAIGAVLPFILGVATLVASTIGQLAGIITPVLNSVFSSVNGTFASVAGAVGGTLRGVLGVLTTWAGNIVTLWRGVVPILGGIFQTLFDIWGQYAGMVQRVIQSFLPSIQTFIGLIYSVVIPIMRAAFTAVKMYLEAWKPIFESLFAIAETIWTSISQVLSSLMDAVKPLFDTFGQGDGFLAAFTGALTVALLPLRLFAWLLSLAVPVIRFFAESMVGTIQLFSTVLGPVISFMASQFTALVGTVQVFAAVILAMVETFRRIASNPRLLLTQGGRNSLGRDFARDFNTAMESFRPPTNERDTDVGASGGGGSWGEGPERSTNRFQGTVLQKSELSSIASAWAKAQTADPNDPQVRLLQQQLNQGAERNNLLEQIVANTSGGGGGDWGGGFGA